MSPSLPAPAPRRFAGLQPLFGKKAVAQFKTAHVCVIGIGGVGSWAAEALARSAVGQITLIDLDNVAESNVNRQIHALDGSFGKAKVSVMAERIGLINPNCSVNTIEDFVTIENVGEMITRQFDWVMDCVDSFKIKAAIAAHCRWNKIRLVTVGAAGGISDPTLARVADLSRTEHDPLLARTRKQLRDCYGYTRNPKRRFGIPAVYSTEQAVYPTPDGGVCRQKGKSSGAAALSCAGGIGSVMTVTAVLGLVATSIVLNRLAQGASVERG